MVQIGPETTVTPLQPNISRTYNVSTAFTPIKINYFNLTNIFNLQSQRIPHMFVLFDKTVYVESRQITKALKMYTNLIDDILKFWMAGQMVVFCQGVSYHGEVLVPIGLPWLSSVQEDLKNSGEIFVTSKRIIKGGATKQKSLHQMKCCYSCLEYLIVCGKSL